MGTDASNDPPVGCSSRWRRTLAAAGIALASIGAMGGTPPAGTAQSLAMDLDFAKGPIGELNRRFLQANALNVRSLYLSPRMEIVADPEAGHPVLRVAYPAGKILPGASGGAFVADLPPANEYYLSFRMKLEKGFDFAKGGKLPGLASGGGRFTGGVMPGAGEGWSARMVWGGDHSISLYLYYIDQRNPRDGETLHFKNGYLTPGDWQTIIQRVKVNNSERPDAVIQVWVNGELKFSKEGFRLRNAPLGLVDSFLFSTFHGGSRPDFAPKTDSYIRFDRFQVSTQPPPGIGITQPLP